MISRFRGKSRFVTLGRVSVARAARVVDIKGAWLVARRDVPHMIARRSGVILNNASVAGLRGMG